MSALVIRLLRKLNGMREPAPAESVPAPVPLQNESGGASTAISKIEDYLTEHPAGERRVVFGGHWSDNPGWLLLSESDQDITSRLAFPDDSVDVIFTEHVIEHVHFVEAVAFIREALRILRPGGTIRIVCPMLDSMLSSNLTDSNGTLYIKNALVPYFSKEDDLLKQLGLGGIGDSAKLFMLNSIFRGHEHRFIWDTRLMGQVLSATGFANVRRCAISEGTAREWCIERRRRGVYMGNDWREELQSSTTYDPESGIVEGQKPHPQQTALA